MQRYIKSVKRNRGRGETDNAVTVLSGEQVIIDQLHGSTESSSQLLRAPCGSFSPLLILIKSSTALFFLVIKQANS